MLNSIFSDNMMIQCNQPIKVWGIDKPEELISVKLADSKAEIKSDKRGRWLVSLPPLPSGQICEMHVKGSKEQVIKNILTGDIWLCSGQSNMEFPLNDVNNANQELELADFPEIRFFNVIHKTSIENQTQVEGKWEICSPKTAKKITGVGYFFAKDIYERQEKPIGLLHSSWGGTRIEAWMSRDALQSCDFMQKEIEEYESSSLDNTIYNQEYKAWEKTIPKDPENRGYKKGYASDSCDSSDWKTLDVPGWWTSQGLEFNGVLWYRKNVTLPKDWDGQECILHLGSCDKSDQTYFNNEKIGSLSIEENSQAWCTTRVYEIPSNIVHSGENTIAVRVFSNLMAGGIIGDANDIYISLKNKPEKSIPLAGKWQYKVEYNFGLIKPPVQPFGEGNPNSPYMLFNNMIKPLLNFVIKGVLWYQGESNAINYHNYRKLFIAMINDWRKCWNIGKFPFYFVQLSSFIAGTDDENISPWGEIRQAQEDALFLENTGMAVTIDIGDPLDIHPKNKQDVGKRLALIARGKTYGESIEFSGPIVDKVQLKNDKIEIYFTNAKGLKTYNNQSLSGFKIQKDKKILDFSARILDDHVILTGPSLNKFVEVSFGYGDYTQCNLYNDFNLPARPFKYRLDS
ncbi:MAG: sialate O-acetylesterase [Verrucomicrobiota bacterium]|nr:sialate O-acetylesterase [Verrucomicrobiota bacterium]